MHQRGPPCVILDRQPRAPSLNEISAKMFPAAWQEEAGEYWVDMTSPTCRRWMRGGKPLFFFRFRRHCFGCFGGRFEPRASRSAYLLQLFPFQRNAHTCVFAASCLRGVSLQQTPAAADAVLWAHTERHMKIWKTFQTNARRSSSLETTAANAIPIDSHLYRSTKSNFCTPHGTARDK